MTAARSLLLTAALASVSLLAGRLVVGGLGACLLRREVFTRVGVLDETQHYSEDTDFILRIFEARIPVTALRQETLYYRRHLESLMAQANDRMQRDFHRAVARSIKRRAALGIRGNLPRMEELLEPGPDRNRRQA